jgi:hypothetical protein
MLAWSRHSERNGAVDQISAICSLIQIKFRLRQGAQPRPRVFYPVEHWNLCDPQGGKLARAPDAGVITVYDGQ